MDCLGASVICYRKGALIMMEGDKTNNIGIVLQSIKKALFRARFLKSAKTKFSDTIKTVLTYSIYSGSKTYCKVNKLINRRELL